MMRRLFLALLCALPWPALAQVVNQGPTISVTTGLQPFPVTAAQSQFLGPDGSPQFFVGLVPSATEYFNALGGPTGSGATLLATNGGTGSVSANQVAQETGGHFFGNGSGTMLEIDDGGGPSTAWITFAPAISGTRAKMATSSGAWQLDFPNSVTSQITQAGQTVAEFGTTGTAATAAGWVRFISSTSVATIQAAGATNTALFFQAAGTGGTTIANSSGSLAEFANAVGNVAINRLQVRAASTTLPVMLQASANNIAIGGTGGGTLLATNATAGYAGIPVTAGTPTGVPAQASANVAYLVFDSTNLKLCAYVTAWKCSGAFQ